MKLIEMKLTPYAQPRFLERRRISSHALYIIFTRVFSFAARRRPADSLRFHDVAAGASILDIGMGAASAIMAQ